MSISWFGWKYMEWGLGSVETCLPLGEWRWGRVPEPHSNCFRHAFDVGPFRVWWGYFTP